MKALTVSQVIRAYFTAWETNDRHLLETLLTDDFTFNSPGDDRISKDEYWEKCWASVDMIRTYRILDLMVDDRTAFIRYECQLRDGMCFKNTEYFRLKGNRINEVEVYFGWEIASISSSLA